MAFSIRLGRGVDGSGGGRGGGLVGSLLHALVVLDDIRGLTGGALENQGEKRNEEKERSPTANECESEYT